MVDVANNFVGEKANRKRLFWHIFSEQCPHKGVLFDEIDTICGFVNTVSIYLRLYFYRGKGLTRLFRQIFRERCPHKGVHFDEIDTICG